MHEHQFKWASNTTLTTIQQDTENCEQVASSTEDAVLT